MAGFHKFNPLHFNTALLKSTMVKNFKQWKQKVEGCMRLMAAECTLGQKGMKSPVKCLLEMTSILELYSQVMAETPTEVKPIRRKEECRMYMDMMMESAKLSFKVMRELANQSPSNNSE